MTVRRRWARLLGSSEHVAALGLIALVLLVYLEKAVVGGQMLSAVSSLYGLAPWNAVAPTDLSHFYNALLIDQAKAHYPWDVLDRAAIHSGYFPTWNPLVLSGTPYFANSQSGLTSVFNIPLWILPLHYALGFAAWLKLSFGGFGTYLLVRQLRLGFWPGVLAGVSYSLCAFNVTWLGHQTLVATAVCLPWLVLAIERVALHGRLADLLALAVLSALAMNGGHPGTETQVMGAAALYLAVRLATVEEPSTRDRLRRAALAVGAITLGVMVMAFVLLPVLKASAGTAGRALRSGGGPVLPASALKTALFPGWWGRPSEGNSGGPLNYVERTLYVGTIALLLCGVALTLRTQWRRKLPFLAIAIIGLGVPFGAPVIHAIVVHLPAFDSVDDSRMAVLFEFAVAVLASFGLQAIIESAANARRNILLVIGLAVLASILAVVAVHPSLHDIRTTLNHFRTGRSYTSGSVLALTSIAWFGVFLATAAIVLALRMRTRLSGQTAAWILVLVAAVDLYHFAYGFQPIGPASQVVPPRTAAIEYLQKHADGYRVFGTAGDLDVDFSMTYGLKDPSGYDPPQPTSRYLQIWQLANPAQTAAAEWIISPQITPTGMQAMDLLGVRYILTSPSTQLPANLSLPLVYRGADALIYENPRASAPAYVPSRIRLAGDGHDDLEDVSRLSFEARREATIESDQHGVGRVQAGRGRVLLQREADNEAVIKTSLTRGGLVVLDAAWAHGWSVQIDGHAAQPLEVDYVMRGVEVPPGQHTVVWRYHVPGLTAGIAISSFAVVVIACIALLLLIRRRRRRPSSLGARG